jgi:hypothetical protein
MNATRRIWILFAACVAWIPMSSHLGKIAAQEQDPAGKGIYSLLTTMFLLFVGGVAMGIPAVLQARRHREQVRCVTRAAAWLVLLSPILVPGTVILLEFIL